MLIYHGNYESFYAMSIFQSLKHSSKQLTVVEDLTTTPNTSLL